MKWNKGLAMFWNRKLPRRKDIVIFGDLDEKRAAENFLGKDMEQAEAMFQDNFIYYGEGLMWMGPKAFCFYVDAAINYLLSKEADEDSDAVSSFLIAVSFQLEHHEAGVRPAFPRIHHAALSMLECFDRYDCDPKIYGDLKSRYQVLLEQVA